MYAQGRRRQGRRRIRTLLSAAAAAAVLTTAACGAGGAGTSDAKDDKVHLTLTTITPNAENPHAKVALAFMDEVVERSNGKLTYEAQYNGTPCPVTESLQCAVDGRADMALTAPAYTPDKFPLFTLSEVPTWGATDQAKVTAFNTVREEFPAVEQELDKVGVKLLAFWPGTHLLIGSHKPVTKPEDLKGLRIRATGATLTAAFAGVGANPSEVATTELYEAIDKKVLDAFGLNVDGTADWNVYEVVEHLTDPGMGSFSTLALMINSQVYERLDPELQKIFDEVSKEFAQGKGLEVLNQGESVKCDAIIKGFGPLTAWEESETERWRNQVEAQIRDTWVSGATKAGHANAGEMYDRFLAVASENKDQGIDPTRDCLAKSTAK